MLEFFDLVYMLEFSSFACGTLGEKKSWGNGRRNNRKKFGKITYIFGDMFPLNSGEEFVSELFDFGKNWKKFWAT